MHCNCPFFSRMIILYVSPAFWIGARGYNLFRYDVINKKWSYFSKLKDKKNALLSSFFLTRRLFRAEITRLYRFRNDIWMCIAKKGIFRYDVKTNTFLKCRTVDRGARPMNLCQDTMGNIYYGEYYRNPERKEVHIYKTMNDGDTWQRAYTFPKGTINHIHGLFNDPYSEKLWVATGDEDSACIFGYTEDGFRTFVAQYQGSQQYRICVPLFYKDFIVFATDSQYKPNVIRKIDRKTGTITDLQEIQGSGIYAVQIGNNAAISTTVEPSIINTDKNSYLWFSPDGEHWKEVLHYRKDIWEKTYFQFGSIRFPIYEVSPELPYGHLIITGRALRKLDGKSLVLSLQDVRR